MTELLAYLGSGAVSALLGIGGGTPDGMNTGFIYRPAVAGIVSTCILAAPLGARLAHYLPKPVLQRIFALMLALIGLCMVSA